MFCSGLSILSNLTFAIGLISFNGSIYEDNGHRISAIRVNHPQHNTHTILTSPYYSKCFEYTNPLPIQDIKIAWIPDEPLSHWDRDELEDELVECKNKYRLLRHRYLSHTLKHIPKKPKKHSPTRPATRPPFFSVSSRSIAPMITNHKRDDHKKTKNKKKH